MKSKKILRMLLLIVASLAGKIATSQTQQPRYDKFVVPYNGYMTVEQWVGWVAHGNSNGMTVICDREVYKQYLYAEIRNRGAVCNTDQDFIALHSAGRFGSSLIYLETLSKPYSNTAWDKNTRSVAKLGDVRARYGYIPFDGEPIAKGTCANVINKHIAPNHTPKPAPAPAPQAGTFNPCDNQYYVLGPMDSNGFQWSSDGTKAYMNGVWYQRYMTDLSGQPYTDGKIHLDTLECQKVKKTSIAAGCTTVVNVYNVNKTTTTAPANEESGPVYSTMGRVYQSPGFYDFPPVAWGQRSTFFSLALALSPMLRSAPQIWRGGPFYQGQSFDGGNQYSYQNPNTYQGGGFDGGNGVSSGSGGGPFAGAGYIPGVAQRVP